jgi:hypothetical protein
MKIDAGSSNWGSVRTQVCFEFCGIGIQRFTLVITRHSSRLRPGIVQGLQFEIAASRMSGSVGGGLWPVIALGNSQCRSGKSAQKGLSKVPLHGSDLIAFEETPAGD